MNKTFATNTNHIQTQSNQGEKQMSILFQIAGIGILTIIITQVLSHAGKSEIATLATLAGVLLVLILILDMVEEVFSTIKSMFGLN